MSSEIHPRRVAVIGVGMLGACVGWNLARRGVGVVFVDAARPGEGVSNWSFSWVNASNKTERRSYFELNVAGMAAYRELAGSVGPQGWWHPSGHLRWAGDSVAQEKVLQTAALLAEWGYRVEVSTGAELGRRLEPGVSVPGDAPVVFYPDEAWVHGRHLVGRLIADAASAPQPAERRFGAAVREIGRAGDGSVRSVILADGTTLPVDAVVNAAGPDASVVARLVGRRLPMRHEPGAVTRIGGSPVPIGRAMHCPHIEVRPDGDDSMVLHSREVDALIDTGEDPADLGRRLHEMARAVVPALSDSRITGTRVSNRPIPEDGFPSVGALPNIPGYYEAVSHSGITLGPVIGRLLAAEIVTGEPDALLADFRPERFGP